MIHHTHNYTTHSMEQSLKNRAAGLLLYAITILFGGTNDLLSQETNRFDLEAIYQQHKSSIMFTSAPYQKEAFGLVLREANKVALELNLPEKLPITETDLTEFFISPFEYSYEEKSIGSVTTQQYVYCVSQGNKFSYLFGTHQNEDCRRYQKQYTLPITQLDTNEAYLLATQWLAAVSMDVDKLNHDYPVIVEVEHDYIQSPPGKFVPVYDVYWAKERHNGSVASVRLFTPTKTLLQLCVEDPKYILRQPLVFTNPASLFPGIMPVPTNYPVVRIHPLAYRDCQRSRS